MPCNICGHSIIENKDTGLCASCGANERKAERNSNKPIKSYQLPKVSQRRKKEIIQGNPIRHKTPNLYYCSDGSRVSQNKIDWKYQRAREKRYAGLSTKHCEGCGAMCNGSAHIIAQARCKVIHKTELIWNPKNFFPACSPCNLAIENPKGEAWKSLRNIEYCLEFIQAHDPELYRKFEVQSGKSLPA